MKTFTNLNQKSAILICIGLLLTFGSGVSNTQPIKLAIVGQSLIKMHPGKHWPNPFGSVNPILESADVGFTNFEMAVDDHCGVPENYQVMLGKPAFGSDRPGNTSGPHAVSENIMEFLSSLNFKLQSLANNHAWDLGDCGVKATMAAAKKYGVTYAGAGMFIAHGDRIFDGLEIYKGRPIFRQFGGFSYQGLQGEGSYDPLVWQGLLGMLTIEDGYIRSMEITPLELNEGNEKEYGDAIAFREKRGFAEVATGELARNILKRFKDLSAKYGTQVKIEGEKAIIEIHKAAASGKPKKSG